MDIFYRIWSNFKNQPDIWFFYGFLATITLSIRKVLVFYPISGVFNEYAGIYLYLSDLLLIFTIGFWILGYLYNKKLNLSIYIHKLSTLINRHNLLITIPLVLIGWSFVSIVWSDNWQIALFRSIKFLEFYLLYLYVIFRIFPYRKELNCSTPVRQEMFHPSRSEMFHVEHFKSNGTCVEHFQPTGQAPARNSLRSNAGWWNNSFKIIIFTGLIQSIIGISQFIIQKSVGIFWLKESLISPSIDGVAKILIEGQKYIRAYGLFPHPNILGGFLLVSIVLSIFYTKMFHPRTTEIIPSQLLRNVPRVSRGSKLFHVEQFDSLRDGTFTYLLPIFTLIQIIAVFLTFSKSAWIGLAIALVYMFCRMFHPSTAENVPPRKILNFSTPATLLDNVPRGTLSSFTWWNNLVSRGRRGTILIVVFIIALALFLPKINFSDFLFKSINERILYLEDSVEVIKSSPLIGIGSGQFVMAMQKYSLKLLELWQFQPVHNVFLMIWSELGIVGLGIFGLFVWLLVRVKPNSYGECSTQKNDRLFHVEQSIISGYARNISKSEGEGGIISDEVINHEQLIIFKGIFLSLIFIMLFDHYLWDIQQGQVIFWLIAGIIANNALYKPKDSILTK